jgi:hypothetical protein
MPNTAATAMDGAAAMGGVMAMQWQLLDNISQFDIALINFLLHLNGSIESIGAVEANKS